MIRTGPVTPEMKCRAVGKALARQPKTVRITSGQARAIAKT